jgi:hypothetical protein
MRPQDQRTSAFQVDIDPDQHRWLAMRKRHFYVDLLTTSEGAVCGGHVVGQGHAEALSPKTASAAVPELVRSWPIATVERSPNNVWLRREEKYTALAALPPVGHAPLAGRSDCLKLADRRAILICPSGKSVWRFRRKWRQKPARAKTALFASLFKPLRHFSDSEFPLFVNFC